MLTKI